MEGFTDVEMDKELLIHFKTIVGAKRQQKAGMNQLGWPFLFDLMTGMKIQHYFFHGGGSFLNDSSLS
jgi:hypothetical protein